MSHYRRRENGTWLITVERGRDPVTGDRIRKYKTVSGHLDPNEVEKEMAKMIMELEYGTYVDPSNMTIGEFLLMWLENECEPNIKSRRSYQAYEETIKKHFIPALGHIPLQKFQKIHAKNYQAMKLRDGGRLDGKPGGLSTNTVRQQMQLLSQVMNYAVEMNMININPIRQVKRPTYKKPKIDYWTQEEVSKILNATKGQWIHDYIYLSVKTGMRQGEILGLKWVNVDLKKGNIFVRQALKKITGEGMVLGSTKTIASERQIPISKKVIKELKKISTRHTKEEVKAEKYQDNDLVICEVDGRNSHPNTVRRRFKKAVEAAGVKYIRPHDMRHTFATLMLTRGYPPKVVQEWLGHKSIEETMDTYSHVIPSLKEMAAGALDDL